MTRRNQKPEPAFAQIWQITLKIIAAILILCYKVAKVSRAKYKLYKTKRDYNRYKKLTTKYRKQAREEEQYLIEMNTIEAGGYSDKVRFELQNAALNRYTDRQFRLLAEIKDVNKNGN